MHPNTLRLLACIFVFYFSAAATVAEESDLASRLGYAADAKLLIIHADDFGMCHSENLATIDAMDNGVVSSASVMAPCAWMPEAAAYAQANPDADIGVHLTLTSEWQDYKWGPLLGAKAASLVTAHGYFHDNVSDFAAAADLGEVEKELRAQIDSALEMGIDVTHLDAHMRAAVSTPELLRIYIKLGREYRVPVMLDGPRFFQHYGVEKEGFVTEDDVLIDGILDARPAHFDSGMHEYYDEMLSSLEPGLYCFLVHVGYDDKEMRAITEGHDYWHAEWRQADYDFVTSQAAKELLEEHGIQVITWREVRDKLLR